MGSPELECFRRATIPGSNIARGYGSIVNSGIRFCWGQWVSIVSIVSSWEIRNDDYLLWIRRFWPLRIRWLTEFGRSTIQPQSGIRLITWQTLHRRTSLTNEFFWPQPCAEWLSVKSGRCDYDTLFTQSRCPFYMKNGISDLLTDMLFEFSYNFLSSSPVTV